MKLPFHRQSVQLVWKHGEEAVCPICDHNNACLMTMSVGKTSIYECRDCHTIFIIDTSEPSRQAGVDRRNLPIMAKDAKVIGRSLGKQCSNCNSFDLKQVDLEFRQRFESHYVESGKGDKFAAARECPTHLCQNCGDRHRY